MSIRRLILALAVGLGIGLVSSAFRAPVQAQEITCENEFCHQWCDELGCWPMDCEHDPEKECAGGYGWCLGVWCPTGGQNCGDMPCQE